MHLTYTSKEVQIQYSTNTIILLIMYVYRMTVLEAGVSAGSVIGSMASSYLLRAVGNVYLLLIATALIVIAYVFTNVFVKESLEGAVQVFTFFLYIYTNNTNWSVCL